MINKQKIDRSIAFVAKIFFYIILSVFAIFFPIVLWQLNLPIIKETYGKNYQVFELFGFCASIALIVFAYVELKKRKKLSCYNILPVIVPVLVTFAYLSIISEYSERLNDYKCYEIAAKAIIEGNNPYSEPRFIYTYPPLTAQILALVYQIVARSILLLHLLASGNEIQEQIWSLVFYFYQCTQLLLISLAFLLCYIFARNLGLKSLTASFLTAALLLFNNPLIRTLKHGQVNLWLLDLFLLAVLLLQRYPLVSGFFIAVGGHIKLYPLILLLPWTVTKQWLAVVGVSASFFSIMLIQSNWGSNWKIWHQFLLFFTSGSSDVPAIASPYVPTAFRNNSLQSFISNFSRVLNMPAGFTNIVLPLVTLAVFTWFLVRFIKREKFDFALAKSVKACTSKCWQTTFKLYGHSVDALALGLLISPSVWEHHYVIAIPIAIWSVATRGYEKPWQVGIGTFLMFCLPTFDVFPFSYHRLLGLLLLLYLTSPKSTINAEQTKVYVT